MLNTLCKLVSGKNKGYISSAIVASFVSMDTATPEGHLKGTRIRVFDDEEEMMRFVLGTTNAQPSASINHSSEHMQHPTDIILHSTTTIDQSPNNILQSPSDIQNLSTNIQQSPSTIQHPSGTIPHSTSGIQHSASVILQREAEPEVEPDVTPKPRPTKELLQAIRSRIVSPSYDPDSMGTIRGRPTVRASDAETDHDWANMQ